MRLGLTERILQEKSPYFKDFTGLIPTLLDKNISCQW